MELELASRLTNAIKQSSLSDKQTKIFSRPQIERAGGFRLTAERRLVGTVGAVGGVVAHRGEVDAHAVAGALPLPAGTPEGWRGAISFIAHVPAVVVPVANPAAQHAVPIVAAEERGRAGARRAGVVLVAAVLTVGMTVTLPVGRDTAPV